MVEVMTDKATVEIPSPRAGRVAKRMYAEGQICPVGKVLIDDRGRGAARPARRRRARAPQPRTPPKPRLRGGAGRRGASERRRRRAARACWRRRPPASWRATSASTSARSPATGRAGRVTSDDVRGRTAAERPPRRAPRAGAGRRRAPTTCASRSAGVRKKIAENAGALEAHRGALHLRRGDRLHRAGRAARARRTRAAPSAARSCRSCRSSSRRRSRRCKKFPQLNATLDEAAGEIVQRQQLPHRPRRPRPTTGLIVPVVRDADRRVARRARRRRSSGWPRPTRTGQGDARRAHRLDLHHHQPGRARRRAGDADHQLPRGRDPRRAQDREAAGGAWTTRSSIRDLMNLSISVDHRVVDGYDAARFVAEIKATLEAPASRDRSGLSARADIGGEVSCRRSGPGMGAPGPRRSRPGATRTTGARPGSRRCWRRTVKATARPCPR